MFIYKTIYACSRFEKFPTFLYTMACFDSSSSNFLLLAHILSTGGAALREFSFPCDLIVLLLA